MASSEIEPEGEPLMCTRRLRQQRDASLGASAVPLDDPLGSSVGALGLVGVREDSCSVGIEA